MVTANLSPSSKRVAVVGSGVAGLGAAWLLSRPCKNGRRPSSPKFHVTLFEREEYVGGHTHTVDYTRPLTLNASHSVSTVPTSVPADGKQASLQAPQTPVDTGFIVFNQLTYPNLVQFFNYLGVKFEESDMSLAVSRDMACSLSNHY
jgi:predicted NAD/FAD-binding protein